MADRDDTPIEFTVADRLLAESTASEVTGVREDMKELNNTMREFIEAHTKLHVTLDAKVNTVQNYHRVMNKVLKIGAATIGLVAGLFSIAKALKLL